MKELASVFFTLLWISGVVFANGFWQTIAAIFLPPYALYLVVEFALKAFGFL